MDEKAQSQENQWKERRKYQRINKTFILTYFDKANPDKKIEITQLKNISKGGICFITTKAFLPDTKIGVELKTPYLSDTTYLEGVVLESREKLKDILYLTRLEFDSLNPQAEHLITKMIEVFVNGGENDHE
ncbi:MAG: PilZ domain-containing protein [Candidatus Zapsychrus exili]|nr:PilZ domain-containing protein [Candidatus Zapsychrus exili]